MQVCLSFPICVSGVLVERVEAVFCPQDVLSSAFRSYTIQWGLRVSGGSLHLNPVICGLSRTFHSHAYPAAITI